MSGEVDYWTCQAEAEYFVAAAAEGYERYGNFSAETIYGKTEGFVYFIAIGSPYVTHVKIGFTRKDPQARMRDLQTGCPFKMSILGFTIGNRVMEAELHDVLREFRVEGEWFEYADYVQRVIDGMLKAEALP